MNQTEFARLGALAANKKRTPKQRRELAQKAANARWAKEINSCYSPKAYEGIHIWLKKNYGKANHCENCGRKRGLKFQWAKIKGKKYETNRKNFWQLCAGCHTIYDRKINHPRFGIIRNKSEKTAKCDY